MKKDFQLGITSALAVALTTTACGPVDDVQQFASRDTAVCVDRHGNRVSDNYCSTSYAGGNNAFLYYYLGRNSAIPYYGDNIRDARYSSTRGSFRPMAGHSYARAPASTSVTRSVAVSRGGFGSSARSGFSGSS